jgi:hypothetical protein
MFLHRNLMRFALAAGLTVASLATARVAEREQSQPSKKPCCFQNPGYAGTCKVEPVGDETCASILAYLNNPMAEGKSYCGGTTVRKGWTEVQCEIKDDAQPRDRESLR